MLKTAIIAALACMCLSQLPDAAVTPDPLCGSTKGCYPLTCPDGGCTAFHLSWEEVGEYLRFKMVSTIPSTGVAWAAVGFSKDNQMKDSSVVMCRMDTMTAEIGHNALLSNAYTSLQTTSSLTNVSLSREGLYMTCTFDRIKTPTELPTQIFSLEPPNVYYLLHAYGLVTDGIPQRHASRQASTSSLSFMAMAGNTTAQLTTDSPASTPMATSGTTHAPSTTTSTAISLNNNISSVLLTCLAVVVTSLIKK